jgi:asparagine synthase (glutamine-hydrolysing)
MAKRILRDWLSSNVPAAYPYARKTGFNPPVGEWIAARKSLIQPLVAGQPGIAETFTREDVARVFSHLEQKPQASWSLLFYALWHSHHVLGVSGEGSARDVLAAAQRLA